MGVTLATNRKPSKSKGSNVSNASTSTNGKTGGRNQSKASRPPSAESVYEDAVSDPNRPGDSAAEATNVVSKTDVLVN